jgi:hypothetical protein
MPGHLAGPEFAINTEATGRGPSDTNGAAVRYASLTSASPTPPRAGDEFSIRRPSNLVPPGSEGRRRYLTY